MEGECLAMPGMPSRHEESKLWHAAFVLPSSSPVYFVFLSVVLLPCCLHFQNEAYFNLYLNGATRVLLDSTFSVCAQLSVLFSAAMDFKDNPEINLHCCKVSLPNAPVKS